MALSIAIEAANGFFRNLINKISYKFEIPLVHNGKFKMSQLGGLSKWHYRQYFSLEFQWFLKISICLRIWCRNMKKYSVFKFDACILSFDRLLYIFRSSFEFFSILMRHHTQFYFHFISLKNCLFYLFSYIQIFYYLSNNNF